MRQARRGCAGRAGWRRASALAGGASALAVAACTLLVDADGLTGPGVDQVPTFDASTDSVLSRDAPTHSSDARPEASDGDGAPCPGTAGPSGVRVGNHCIDATEVTYGHWLSFRAAVFPLTSLPPTCAFKTSYHVGSGPDPASPVKSVDWCEAWAFCAWAGKRLCGSIAGGSLPPASVATKDDAWFMACSRGATRIYPYGQSFVGGACATLESDDGGTYPCGTRASCVGGYNGVFDMSGNVREWQDSCGAAAGAGDECSVRGGSANDPASSAPCANFKLLRRDTFTSYTGFRCCSD